MEIPKKNYYKLRITFRNLKYKNVTKKYEIYDITEDEMNKVFEILNKKMKGNEINN